MKRLTPTLIISILLTSCTEPEYRWIEYGGITSLRIDDDAQYHFSTDRILKSDVSKYDVSIERGCYLYPILFIKEHRCPADKICNEATSEWSKVQHSDYKIGLPNDYKIETFDD